MICSVCGKESEVILPVVGKQYYCTWKCLHERETNGYREVSERCQEYKLQMPEMR